MRYLLRFSLVAVFALLCVGAGTPENQLTEGIQTGNLAPEFAWQGFEMGENDYVLLQFWAAYDPQSRVVNTQMHNAIAQLETGKIRLISVSMDEEPAVFKGVVKTEHLDESTQWNEPKGKKSELFKKFRLKNGFGNWLINGEGMIVARNICPSDIRELLDTL